MRELLAKYGRAYWRDTSYNFTRILLAIVYAIVFGVIYYGRVLGLQRLRGLLAFGAISLPPKIAILPAECHVRLLAGAAKPRDKLRIADAQNVLGILYSAMSFVGLSNQMAVMPVVGYERVVFYRWGDERAGMPAWYTTTAGTDWPPLSSRVGSTNQV